MAALEDDVRAAVAQALAAAGSDASVELVTITPAGRRRVARIALDRRVPELVGDSPLDPLSLDEIGDLTRVVGEALDENDLLGEQPYTLEVTTPGTDRPLTEAAHYRRAVGRLVVLTTGAGELRGRVVATTAEGVELDVAGVKGRPGRRASVPFAEVTTGLLELEFSRPSGVDLPDDLADDDLPDDDLPDDHLPDDIVTTDES